MEFEYYFEKISEYRVKMRILPNESIKGDVFMIGAWLFGDVQRGNSISDAVKNFMENPEIKEEELSGNSCDVFLKRDFTTIRWVWYDEVPNSCTLPTEMLYEIIKIWVAKNNELLAEKEKTENK